MNNNTELKRLNFLPGQRKCSTCKGTGINPVFVMNVCPKCNGEGVVGVGYGTNTS